MARRLRLQYQGALYHVINRGNYRRDVFETSGAARSFEATLMEACDRHRWRLHAHALMRNHYHLALETPQADLVEGMHWLQSTFATRFNRFRSDHGHLFQGRYQALLIEDSAALVRVVDYIHLNPVRAGIVTAPEVATYPWSSLGRFVRGPRPPCFSANVLLTELGLKDSADGWSRYVTYLAELADNGRAKVDQDRAELTSGWAIGTTGWRRALAKKYAQLALSTGIGREEIQELKEARWQAALENALRELGKNAADIERDPKGVDWKIAVASRLRHEATAPHRWIARTLNMGSPASVRVYLCRKN